MTVRAILAASTVLAALSLPAAAQDAAILRDGGPFEPIPGGLFDILQTGPVNVVGAAQTSALPDLFVGQTGYYNRGAIVQTGADPRAEIEQTGSFNRALIIQTQGATAGFVEQDGTYNSAFVLQSGAIANTASTAQNGPNNAAFARQDAALGVPTSAEAIRTIVTNFIYAPETVRAGVETVELDGVAFSDAIQARLADGPGFCGPAAASYVSKDPVPLPSTECGTFRLFLGGGTAAGEQESRLGALGFDYDRHSLILGAEIPFTERFLGGVALRYARTEADVRDGLADIDADSYGVSVFGDYRDGGLGVSAMAFYSRSDLDISRPGIGGATTADPDADGYGGSIRASYLFDLGAVEAGPLLGYTYARAELDGYDESGNVFLAQRRIGGQDSESQLGLVGGRIAFSGEGEGYRLRGTVDLAYERDFDGDDFSVQRTEFAFAPDTAVWTPVRSLGDVDYFHLAGSATVDFTNRFSLQLSAGGRFGDRREEYRLGAELRKAF